MSYNYCNIHTHNSSAPVFSDVRIPNGFYHKAKGLLGEKELKKNTGMLFKKCNSIHMIGMKIPLDILFLSSNGIILKCVSDLKPWRMAACMKSAMTLELPSGSIEHLGLKLNMKLEIKECRKSG